MTDTDMAADEAPPDPPRRGGRLPLLLGLLLALAGGGGGFFAISSGLIPGVAPAGESAEEVAPPPAALPDVAFVPLEPMVISLGGLDAARHLRFSAQLEVPATHQAEVEQMLPRVVDVLNAYLRAVEVAELADRTALARLRAQMLRRVQTVVGRERVRDLLIMEFVLN